MVSPSVFRILRAAALAALLLPVAAQANEGMRLQPAPINSHDVASLQNGAKLFVNYCLNCHSASFMRYNRLTDIGLTEEQIKSNLLLTNARIGDTMKAAIDPQQAKDWFGGNPPDLTVIARSRTKSVLQRADIQAVQCAASKCVPLIVLLFALSPTLLPAQATDKKRVGPRRPLPDQGWLGESARFRPSSLLRLAKECKLTTFTWMSTSTMFI